MHTRRTVLGITLLACATTPALAQTRYEPNWESLDKRPVAPWFDEAKFGIFIHWGVFSVPAWGPRGQYAEWYWRRQAEQQKGADKGKGGPFWDFHKRVYGPDFKYQAFAPQFRAELFDPDAWADVFARSGARYVVLTSKHHDGYALWPSAQSPGWNAMDTGPKRDLAGDLSAAVKKKGVKFGFYYSLYEWYHPLWKADVKRYVGEHMLPQMKDLVTRYKPELLWTDGEWDHPSETFRSTEFLAWLFNEAPGGADIVINDRWGKETRSKHGGFFTTEYGKVHEGQELGKNRKWEECRGMGASFGYNRNETSADYKSTTDLVATLVKTVATGGNLLLNIGPTADGRIPVEMEERLLGMGRWLATNGEAIYGSRPFRVIAQGDNVRYTQKGDAVYAIALGWPGRTLVLEAPKAGPKTKITLLGVPTPLEWKKEPGKSKDGARLPTLVIHTPVVSPDDQAVRHAYVFKLTGVE